MGERNTAVLTHVLGILTLFVGPLVVYFLFRKKATPWLRDHLDESVNYNILALIVFVLLIVLALVFTYAIPALAMMSLIVLILALLIFPVKVILELVACIKAGRGKPFHFPLDIKLIR